MPGDIVTLAAAEGPPDEVLIDRRRMKAHRSAGGGKEDARPQRSVSTEAVATANCTRSPMAKARRSAPR